MEGERRAEAKSYSVEEIRRLDNSRAFSDFILHSFVTDYDVLNPSVPSDGKKADAKYIEKAEREVEKIFNALAREKIDVIAVQGVSSRDRTTGKRTLQPFGDADSKAALWFFKVALILNVKRHRIGHFLHGEDSPRRVGGAPIAPDVKRKRVEYMHPSAEPLPGAINVDFGKESGVAQKNVKRMSGTREEELSTVIFDHHGRDAERDTSSVKLVFETLKDLGFFREAEAADKDFMRIAKGMVEFLTEHDNGTNPKRFETFPSSDKTIAGLINFLEPEIVYQLMKKGYGPYDQIKDEDLDNISSREKTLREISERRKKNVDESLDRIRKLEQKNFTSRSGKYGKIILDAGKGKIPCGFEAAKCAGYNVYVYWHPVDKNQENIGVFVSINEMKEGDELDEKKFPGCTVVRGHLVVSGQGKKIQMSLEQLLKALGVETENVSKEIKSLMMNAGYAESKDKLG